MAFAGCALCGMGCAFSAIYFMFRAASLRKQLVPWQLAVGLINVFFDPAMYTNEGQRAARRCRQCAFGFITFWVVGIAIGISTVVAH